MIFINILLSLLCVRSMCGQDEVVYYVEYSDDRSGEYGNLYPQVVGNDYVVDESKPWLKEKIHVSDLAKNKARWRQTNPAIVPYDKEVGILKVEMMNGNKQSILIKGFRTVTIKWINDRLLHISCGVGHAASLVSIYDCLDSKWIYQNLEFYILPDVGNK